MPEIVTAVPPNSRRSRTHPSPSLVPQTFAAYSPRLPTHRHQHVPTRRRRRNRELNTRVTRTQNRYHHAANRQRTRTHRRSEIGPRNSHSCPHRAGRRRQIVNCRSIRYRKANPVARYASNRHPHIPSRRSRRNGDGDARRAPRRCRSRHYSAELDHTGSRCRAKVRPSDRDRASNRTRHRRQTRNHRRARQTKSCTPLCSPDYPRAQPHAIKKVAPST